MVMSNSFGDIIMISGDFLVGRRGFWMDIFFGKIVFGFERGEKNDKN